MAVTHFLAFGAGKKPLFSMAFMRCLWDDCVNVCVLRWCLNTVKTLWLAYYVGIDNL